MSSPCLGAALVTAAALLLAGCGSDGQPDATGPTSTTPSPSPSATPTVDPTSSTAPGTATPRPTGLRGLLPTARELPGLNAQWRWRVSGTGPAGNEPFGACAPAGLESLGAQRGVLRSYAAADGSDATAQALAASFVDPISIERMRRVLVSLHDKCRQRLLDQGLDDPNLTPLREVRLGDGVDAWWYLASWATGPDDGHFQAFGMVSKGTRMVLLTMDHDGQDHNYPTQQDPMARAIRTVGGFVTS